MPQYQVRSTVSWHYPPTDWHVPQDLLSGNIPEFGPLLSAVRYNWSGLRRRTAQRFALRADPRSDPTRSRLDPSVRLPFRGGCGLARCSADGGNSSNIGIHFRWTITPSNTASSQTLASPGPFGGCPRHSPGPAGPDHSLWTGQEDQNRGVRPEGSCCA